MISTRKRNVRLVAALVLALLLLPGYFVSNAQDTGKSKAVFYVSCYDVGKDALVGLEGVSSVDRGFRNFKEINTVYYDPAVITVEEMEKALKKAGTYLETVK